MESYVYWIIAAILLVTVELLTGTFYLLVLGCAAVGAALVASLGMGFGLQVAAALVVAVAGVLLVHRYRTGATSVAGAANTIDVGQRVTIESWINEGEGLARVHYRGTLWDARVIGDRGRGPIYYIRSVDGNMLHIASD